MLFGKYRGHTLGYILDQDPEYICWLWDNDVFDIDSELLKEAMRSKRQRIHIESGIDDFIVEWNEFGDEFGFW